MSGSKIFLCIITLLFASASQAETTGNELYSWLGSNESAINLKGYAYLDGVLDAEDFYLTNEIFSSIGEKDSASTKFKVAHICFGDSKVTYGQIKDIVYKYLADNPAKRHIRAHSLVRFALLEDFACAKNPPSAATK